MKLNKKWYGIIISCIWVLEVVLFFWIRNSGVDSYAVDFLIIEIILRIVSGVLCFMRIRKMDTKWMRHLLYIFVGAYFAILKNLFRIKEGGITFSLLLWGILNIPIIIAGCITNETDEEEFENTVKQALARVEKTEAEREETRRQVKKFLLWAGGACIAVALLVLGAISVNSFIGRNNKYVKKIWVMEEWNGESYEDKISFRINRIKGKNIEGILATGAIAEPYFYAYSYDTPANIGAFSGTIKNGTAHCEFQDEAGNKGSLEITMIDDNCLRASVSYLEMGEDYVGINNVGEYSFRPYKLSDVSGFTWEETQAKEIVLPGKYWDKVRFVAGTKEDANMDYESASCQ